MNTYEKLPFETAVSISRDGAERTVYTGQLVSRDHPIVRLHPSHFVLPPHEER